MRPEFDPYIEWYVNCFFELSKFRIELHPIDLQTYILYMNINEIENDLFITYMQRADIKYREYMAKKQKEEMEKASKKART